MTGPRFSFHWKQDVINPVHEYLCDGFGLHASYVRLGT
jgi:hypothetical protein